MSCQSKTQLGIIRDFYGPQFRQGARVEYTACNGKVYHGRISRAVDGDLRVAFDEPEVNQDGLWSIAPDDPGLKVVG